MLQGSDRYVQCAIEGCTQRVRKMADTDGYASLTPQQMMQGFGCAEECQLCHALHCDHCYPSRDNVCARCGERRLKLVIVEFETGRSAFLGQTPSGAVDPPSVPVLGEPRGSDWAIQLRWFLTGQPNEELFRAIELLNAAASKLGKGVNPFRRQRERAHQKNLHLLAELLESLAHEDWGPLVSQFPAVFDRFRATGTPPDVDSVALIWSACKVRMGQGYLMAPPEIQAQILQAGLTGCVECIALCKAVQDYRCLAEFHEIYGMGLWSARQYDEALRAHQASVGIWRMLAARDQSYRRKLGSSLASLGGALGDMGELAQCLDTLRESENVLRSDPGARREYGLTLKKHALVCERWHQYDQALALYREASAVLEERLRAGERSSTDNPHGIPLWAELTRIRVAEASCAAALGRPDEAEAILSHELELRVGQADQYGTIGELLIARAQCKLAGLLYGRWKRETRSGGSVDEHIHESAVSMLQAAAATYKEHQEQGAGSASVEEACQCFLQLAHALAYDGDLSGAEGWIALAERLTDQPVYWRERVEVLELKRTLDRLRLDDPMGGLAWAKEAVSLAEFHIGQLSPSELVNRDLLKSNVEMCYLCCLAHHVRSGEHEEAFQIMESLRRVERLAFGSESKDVLTTAQASDFARQWGLAYLAIEVAPGGTVFLAVSEDGTVISEAAQPGWPVATERLQDCIKEVDEYVQIHDQFPPINPFRQAAEEAFERLPEPIRMLLCGSACPLFLSIGGHLQNVPVEALFSSEHGWLGLRRPMSYVASFDELRRVIDVQPDPSAKTAVVAAGPGTYAELIIEDAGLAAAVMARNGFHFLPEGELLSGTKLSPASFARALTLGASLVLFVGHGRAQGNRGYLHMGEQFSSEDLQLYRLRAHPIVHLECCWAGVVHYHGGGHSESLSGHLLRLGASCCLVSRVPVIGLSSNIVCRELFELLLDKHVEVGEALFKVKKSRAAQIEHPMFWLAPQLYGNPFARID